MKVCGEPFFLLLPLTSAFRATGEIRVAIADTLPAILLIHDILGKARGFGELSLQEGSKAS